MQSAHARQRHFSARIRVRWKSPRASRSTLTQHSLNDNQRAFVPLLEPVVRRFCRHGLGDEISLRNIAPGAPHKFPIRPVFHALDHDLMFNCLARITLLSMIACTVSSAHADCLR